jgi:endonuclease YncB( thermonuclease family)
VRAVLAGAVGIGAAGAVAMIGVPTDLFGRAAPGPDRITAAPGQVAVIGGDTLRLESKVVLLRGVVAPERGERCRDGLDCGGAAASALAQLVRDRRVECRLTGRDDRGRPLAACAAEGVDLSRTMVASGWARAQPDAPELTDAERQARQQRVGLWSDAMTH